MTEENEQSELEMIAELERRWNCKIHRFGKLFPVDCYATQKDQVVAVFELKDRSIAGDSGEVFFPVRKWLSLQMLEIGMGVPAYFVVRFADGGIRWVALASVAGKKAVLGGRYDRGIAGDIEPMFRIDTTEWSAA